MDPVSARGLPSVEVVLARLRQEAGPSVPHPIAVDATRRVLSECRAAARTGTPPPPLEEITAMVAAAARQAGELPLRRVVNATGVVLQTNLGRAPLSPRAIAAMTETARGYTNVEYDLGAGARGSRHDHLRDLLRRTTGAEDGIVFNNNAAALLAVLMVFAAGREVIVSRGQAVEIGGGVRIPEILVQSGARLVEVGTTNRTYAHDYAAAAGPGTAAILAVHPSNFRVTGFTASPSRGELAAVAADAGVLFVDDLGSGCLLATERFGMAHEPTVQESVAAGAGLVLFSGDKLLGGPQAGIIVGRSEHVDRLRRHPLARALRVDKLTIAALGATLLSYVEGRECEEIPVWRMLSQPLPVLRRRAARWARVAGSAGRVATARSMVGGGSLPGEGPPTWCAAITPPAGAAAFATALRRAEPPIVTRLENGAAWFDPRTVDLVDDRMVADAIANTIGTIDDGGQI